MCLTVLSEAPLGIGASFWSEILGVFFHLLFRGRAVNLGNALGLNQNPI